MWISFSKNIDSQLIDNLIASVPKRIVKVKKNFFKKLELKCFLFYLFGKIMTSLSPSDSGNNIKSIRLCENYVRALEEIESTIKCQKISNATNVEGSSNQAVRGSWKLSTICPPLEVMSRFCKSDQKV